jgi:hypothetical protein
MQDDVLDYAQGLAREYLAGAADHDIRRTAAAILAAA